MYVVDRKSNQKSDNDQAILYECDRKIQNESDYICFFFNFGPALMKIFTIASAKPCYVSCCSALKLSM